MNRWLQIAVVCGATSLTIGITIFLAWLLTRWNGLMMAGILTVYGGVGVVAIGAVSVAVFVWKSLRAGQAPRKQVVRRAVAVGSLLLLNVVVAAIIIASVTYLETRYVVTVVNASSAEVRSFVVTGGGVTIDVGMLPPGAEAHRVFFIKHDGVLKGEGVQGERRIEGVIEGYVTHGMGGNMLVKITPSGTLDVADRGRSGR